MYACMHIYLYICILYVCMYAHICTYLLYTYICSYVHTRTHTHTDSQTHTPAKANASNIASSTPSPPHAPTTCNTPHKSAAPAAPRELSQILKSQQKRPPTGQKRPATVQKDLLQDALTQKFSKVSKRDLLLGKRDLRRHYRERFTECVPAACEFARMLISPLRIEK